MPQLSKPKFLRVATEGWPQRVVPYGANLSLAFVGPEGEDIRIRPQLYGRFLALGVNQEVDPLTAKGILEFLRKDIPRFYTLKSFLLRDVPLGSSEKTARIVIKKFSPDRVELLSLESGQTYTVRILPGGDAECTCPDFFYRRRKSGTWCKHIKSLHRELKEEFSPDMGEFPFALPLWEIDELSQEARFIETLGGLYEVMSHPPAEMEGYTHRRGEFDKPLLGVEFEIPERRGAEMTLLLRVISVLKKHGIVSHYERDASVDGGELKLTPFPATVEEVLKRGQLLKDLRALTRGLFVSSKHSGLHVHVNMWPFHQRVEEIPDLLRPFVILLEKRLSLVSIFGRPLNPYAVRMESSLPPRYKWVNFTSLPHSVEVRLGCSKHGNPIKILLMGLFMQRAFWAIMEGRFEVPPLDASREELLSAFSKLLSRKEREYIVPLLREALL